MIDDFRLLILDIFTSYKQSKAMNFLAPKGHYIKAQGNALGTYIKQNQP